MGAELGLGGTECLAAVARNDARWRSHVGSSVRNSIKVDVDVQACMDFLLLYMLSPSLLPVRGDSSMWDVLLMPQCKM